MKKKELTSKETKIAFYLVSGMSAKTIAKKTGLSLRTVEYYQRRIKEKLECQNTYQTGYKVGVALMNQQISFEEQNHV